MASPIKGYRGRRNLEVSGIWSQEESGEPHFFEPRYGLPLADLPRLGFENPTWVCSSSSGLVLCRDSKSHYFVSNPFLEDRCHPLPRPRRPHPPRTPAVIAIDLKNPRAPIFHVICAVREGAVGFYTFDTYSSNTRAWRYNHGINLQCCDPKADTGVSCGRIAYWLTRIPLLAIRYDVKNNAATFLSLTEPVPHEVLWYRTTRMQLGRVGDKLGLLVANEAESRVELHILRGFNQWMPPCFLEVRIREDASWAQRKRLRKRGDVLICREMPKLIRFESFKMEVLLLVDGRVVVWEGSEFDPGRRRLVRSEREAESHVSNGVAHVFTTLIPWMFFWHLA